MLSAILGGCGPQDELMHTGTDDPIADAAPVAVFRAAYVAVADRFIEPLPVAVIAERGFAGFADLDPDIRVVRSGDTLLLTHAGRRVGSLPAPAAGDPDGWAVATAALWRAAQARSPAVAAAGAEAVYGATLGAIAGSLDRYAAYASAASARRARERRDGQLGFGLTIEIDADGRARVGTVTPGGPADRAGVRQGGAITGINGTPIAELSVAEIAFRLEGGRGDRLRLAIGGAAGRPPRLFRLQRMPIVADTVREVLADGIAHYQIAHFNQGTVAALATRLQTAPRRASPPLAGVVLDLRGNTGGLLQAAVKVADLLLTPGPIATTRGRHPESRQAFTASGGDIALGLPVVVLVDGRTASAAEVLAAALQDRGRAVVVGGGTYGKGWVQTVVPLPNQGELTLTWAELMAPAGRSLTEGVRPALCTTAEAGAITEAGDAITEADGGPAGDGGGQLDAPCPRGSGGGADLAAARRLIADPALYATLLAPTAGHLAAARGR